MPRPKRLARLDLRAVSHHEPAPTFLGFWSAPAAAALFWRTHLAREDVRHGFIAPSRPKAARSRRTPRRSARNERLASPGLMVPMQAKKRKYRAPGRGRSAGFQAVHPGSFRGWLRNCIPRAPTTRPAGSFRRPADCKSARRQIKICATRQVTSRMIHERFRAIHSTPDRHLAADGRRAADGRCWAISCCRSPRCRRWIFPPSRSPRNIRARART